MMKNNVLKKKKILIIYPQLNEPYSGGQVIDFSFIQQIVNSDKFVCSYLLNSVIPNVSILGYIYYTLCHIREIMNNDIIFSNSRLYPRLFPCFLLIKLLRSDVKILVYHHHFNYFTQTGVLKWIHKFFELAFLKIVNIVIIPSAYVKNEMERLIPKADVRYIEIGFNLKPYWDVNKHKKNNLLVVGTIEKRKRVHQIVSIAKFLKDSDINFHVNVVGKVADWVYFNMIMKEIVEENLTSYITFHGRVSAEKLEENYRSADVFLFPSSHEGYGMVLIEAMSYSLPIIAYRNSAIPFSVSDGVNGLLVEDDNVMEYCQKVKKLLVDDRLWNKLRKSAYNYSLEVNTLDKMKEDMYSYIDEM